MNRIKIFAMAAVAMMLLSGFTFLQESQSSDAAEADLDFMNPGSWTWDADTGRGPFNSFYAAFVVEPSFGYYATLNPYDLTKTIDGQTIPDGLNIMWVLPTVYMKHTSTTLSLTDDEDSGAYAFGHTVDGHTYNYLCIGVYEASEYEGAIDHKTYLTSISGATPSTNHSRPEYREMIANYSIDPDLRGKAMLWNFDQWNLYRDIAYMVMENANSQNTVGNGYVYSTDPTTFKTTGLLDTAGPYAGNPGTITDAASAANNGSDSAKLFIENAWGNVQEFVDGCVFVGRYTAYIDSSSAPTDTTTTSSTVSKVDWTMQTGFPSSINASNSRAWAMPGASVNGSQTTGLCDYTTVATTGQTSLIVGGAVSASAATAVQAGIANMYTNQPLSYSAANVGTRLAFVCDSLPAGGREYSIDLNFDSSKITTGSDFFSVTGKEPVSHVFPAEFYTINITAAAGGSVSQQAVSHVPAGEIIMTDGASMTVGGITIQAIPSDPTQEYIYSFNKWVDLPAGGIVTSDVTITATFNERLQKYNVTWIIGDQEQTEEYYYGNMPRHADPTPPEGMVFKGWVPTIVTVTGDATYTAQFVTPSDTDPTHELLKLVPFFIVIAMVMAAVGTALVKGTDPMTIAKLAIGLTIGVILLATLVIPAIGGL